MARYRLMIALTLLFSGVMVAVIPELLTRQNTLVAAVSNNPPAIHKPDFVIEPPIHVFGDVGQGETHDCTFRFTNNTQAHVKIIEIAKSCSCNSTESEQTLVPAGQSTAIRVRWRTSTKRASVTENLTLMLSDERHKTPVRLVPFSIRANVQSDYTATPDVLNFNAGDGEKIIQFSHRDDKPMKLIAAIGSHDGITANFSDDLKQVRVKIDLKRLQVLQPEMHVLVGTNHPRDMWCRIPIILHTATEKK